MREAGTAAAAAPRLDVDRPEPTYWLLARRGLPTLALDGVVPIALFYAGQRLDGLALGIALASAAAAGALAWELRRGCSGLLAKLSLAFVAVPAVVGLVPQSATVYRESVVYRRIFGVESLVWAGYLGGRGTLRLAALLRGDGSDFVVVTFLTGTPVFVALTAWSVWYARRRFESAYADRTE